MPGRGSYLLVKMTASSYVYSPFSLLKFFTSMPDQFVNWPTTLLISMWCCLEIEMSIPTPFFYMVEDLADVKEKAASLDTATVKMKLEDKCSVSLLSVLCRCRLFLVANACVSCLFLVFARWLSLIMWSFVSDSWFGFPSCNCPSVCDVCFSSDCDSVAYLPQRITFSMHFSTKIAQVSI